GNPITNSRDFAVAAYTSSGALDTSFNALSLTPGVVTTDFATNDDLARGIILDASGRIVVVGSSVASGVSHTALARYTSDGLPDLTFAVTGHEIVSLGASDLGVGVALDGSNYLIGGQADGKFALAHLDSLTGLLGSVSTVGGGSEIVDGMAVAGDGK